MNILVIDDSDSVRTSLGGAFTLRGHVVAAVASGYIPDGFRPDVVVCDYDLGLCDHRNGVEIIEDLRLEAPDARYVICSGLPREVPADVEFFSKAAVLALVKAIGEAA